jgi:hypothetical protein
MKFFNDKININLIVFAFSLLLGGIITYYSQSEFESKFNTFDILFSIYSTAVMAVIFYVIFNLLIENKSIIKSNIWRLLKKSSDISKASEKYTKDLFIYNKNRFFK